MQIRQASCFAFVTQLSPFPNDFHHRRGSNTKVSFPFSLQNSSKGTGGGVATLVYARWDPSFRCRGPEIRLFEKLEMRWLFGERVRKMTKTWLFRKLCMCIYIYIYTHLLLHSDSIVFYSILYMIMHMYIYIYIHLTKPNPNKSSGIELNPRFMGKTSGLSSKPRVCLTLLLWGHLGAHGCRFSVWFIVGDWPWALVKQITGLGQEFFERAEACECMKPFQ